MAHNFKIGQTVTLAFDRLRHTQGSSFEILGLLPPLDGDPQYLVKSDLEKCRRVVLQSVMTDEPRKSAW